MYDNFTSDAVERGGMTLSLIVVFGKEGPRAWRFKSAGLNAIIIYVFTPPPWGERRIKIS